MKQTLANLRGAVLATLLLATICGGAYPLAVWGVAQLVFPALANGSLLVSAEGRILGSRLIGQGFTAARYFHPRPSAAGRGYDATASGGSNLGPTSRKLRDAVRERVAAYRWENGLAADAPVPAEAVTASGSGLDPHISPRNADLQARRVACARGVSEAQVRQLIQAHTEKPDLGIFGVARVNVLELNLALDAW